jgi:hypothetical protein
VMYGLLLFLLAERKDKRNWNLSLPFISPSH